MRNGDIGEILRSYIPLLHWQFAIVYLNLMQVVLPENWNSPLYLYILYNQLRIYYHLNMIWNLLLYLSEIWNLCVAMFIYMHLEEEVVVKTELFEKTKLNFLISFLSCFLSSLCPLKLLTCIIYWHSMA
jgi:ABC-type iron transport system FetAB permease component